MSELVTKIFRTTDYSKFKVLYGNREVTAAKTNRLIKSIKENGYIMNPISVNEKMEIVDGQGRFSALQALKMPVDYFIVNGAGIRECMVLNLNTQNWNVFDFVKSYAEQGNINYQRLLHYHKVFPQMKVYLFINALCGGSGYNYETIVGGRVQVDENTFEKVFDYLNYLNENQEILKGAPREFVKAVSFALSVTNIDKTRLTKAIANRLNTVQNATSLKNALSELSRIYNFKARGDYIYFEAEYDLYKRKKTAKKRKADKND